MEPPYQLWARSLNTRYTCCESNEMVHVYNGTSVNAPYTWAYTTQTQDMTQEIMAAY